MRKDKKGRIAHKQYLTLQIQELRKQNYSYGEIQEKLGMPSRQLVFYYGTRKLSTVPEN